MVELLAGPLVGAAHKNKLAAKNWGNLVLAIHPRMLGDADTFYAAGAPAQLVRILCDPQEPPKRRRALWEARACDDARCVRVRPSRRALRSRIWRSRFCAVGRSGRGARARAHGGAVAGRLRDGASGRARAQDGDGSRAGGHGATRAQHARRAASPRCQV
eukprot:6118633-Prymnesium_polylepis.1